MEMYGWGNLNETPDSDRAALTGLRYPNLYSIETITWIKKLSECEHGCPLFVKRTKQAHLVGTQEDWLRAFWGGRRDDNPELVAIDDDFMEPITLLRDVRGIMNTYRQTHTMDCGYDRCYNCNTFVR